MDPQSSPSYIPLDRIFICIHFPRSSPLVQRQHISQLRTVSPTFSRYDLFPPQSSILIFAKIVLEPPDLILTGTMTIQMEDILANRVPTPWTYASFVAYLSDNYCLEVLQFALAAAQYKERYDFVSSIPGRRVSLPSQESQDLLILWTSLVETYLLPDGEREVNLPSQIRDPIIGYTLEQRAADPQVLELAILATWELMEGLILSSDVSEVPLQSCLPAVSQPSDRFEIPNVHAGNERGRRARVADILHSSRPRLRKIIISLFDLFARHHVSRSREYTRRFSH